MKINNSIEFFNWVRSQGLVNLSPEVASFVRCVEEQMRMCNCDPEAARRAKNEQCRNLYCAFLGRAGGFKEQLLMKTGDSSLVLCHDGQTVVSLTR